MREQYQRNDATGQQRERKLSDRQVGLVESELLKPGRGGED